jgi:hypothetical protein
VAAAKYHLVMKTRQLLALGIPAIILATALLNAGLLSGQQKVPVPQPTDDDSLKLIAGYIQWKKANEQPQLMRSRLLADCVAPTPEQKKLDQLDPHIENFITVYVNQAGSGEFMGKQHPKLSEGTVIVKEKLPWADTNATPELLTVMVKRKAGFNVENGNWEYFTFNGAGTKVTSRGKLESCQDCHAQRKRDDYVFRTYVPIEINRQWK